MAYKNKFVVLFLQIFSLIVFVSIAACTSEDSKTPINTKPSQSQAVTPNNNRPLETPITDDSVGQNIETNIIKKPEDLFSDSEIESDEIAIMENGRYHSLEHQRSVPDFYSERKNFLKQVRELVFQDRINDIKEITTNKMTLEKNITLSGSALPGHDSLQCQIDNCLLYDFARFVGVAPEVPNQCGSRIF